MADDDYEVIFQQNATMALNTIIKGLLTEKDHVITTVTEHNSVLRPLYQLGLAISFLPLTTSYEVDLTMLEKLKQINTKAVIVSHVSNVTGSALNLEKISHFCRTNKLLLLVDVAQSAGVLPINCTKYALDAICFTGHKSLFGPQGIGGICLKKH
ncbi:aminotransferase class V-fold PLP-dependent enzyme [Enterococcus termitis]